MTEIRKRAKPLSVNPLKTSSTTGAALAFLGVDRAIPMLHGSQGCTAFAKVFFVRHFREPIPLQTTAMDQASTVLGADDNVVQGLETIARKQKPALIGLPTTGLSETQGADVRRNVREFRAAYPEHDAVAVVPVDTPDYVGCLESGFALAVKAMVDVLVPADRSRVGLRPKQVNLLVNASLTPGDLEHLRELFELFGLRPVVFPDVGDSLDGHLIADDFTPLTFGGTPVSEIRALNEAVHTVVVGRSLDAAADLLAERSGVPDTRFDHLMGLAANDRLVQLLAELSGRGVPPRLERWRAQLQDAMVDCHFMLGFARIGIAADPDLLLALSEFVTSFGAEVVAAVAPDRAPALADVPADAVQLGDLEDLETLSRAARAQLIISNSHAADTADRLGVPLLRAGFPQYDLIGGYARQWIGYRGSRQALFDLSNLLLDHHGHHDAIAPYHAVLRGAGPGEVAHAATEPGRETH
ncbi:MAG: nitrogenase iron-molybdenum cofactor biosynthesis protein NifN [Rhodocyclaceae bacterium]|nr:nitrogenase iron-molybdenum cofactor biosynthesis protein NifN [Rhodocyclaceae bacterium]